MATYLSKTFSSAGNQKTWTWSGWVKYTGTGGGADFTIFSGGTGLGASGNRLVVQFLAGESEKVMASSGNTSEFAFKTNKSFRDPSSWYHFVLAMDTTQATASNRFKMYVNGSQITDTSQLTYPAQDLQLGINSNQAQYIGLRTSSNDTGFNGYMADVHFIDGSAKVATDFGETDSTTGVWKPKTYSGSYGTNGYKLEFKNSGALGTDTSGNSNTWTVNNAATNAQVTDTPSNNFATLNPEIWNTTTNFSNVLYNENTRFPTSLIGNSTKGWPAGTLAVNKGKWYAEYFCEYISSQNASGGPGIYDYDYNSSSLTAPTATAGGILYDPYGRIRTDGSDAGSFGTWTTNDIIGIYMDLDNNELRYSKNGSILNSGNSMATITNPAGASGGDYWTFCPYDESGNAFDASMNFGSPNSYFGSCTNTDNAGLGKFKYSPTLSGTHYYALCTKNINSYG